MEKIKFNDSRCPKCQEILPGREIEIDVEATLKKIFCNNDQKTTSIEDGSYRIGSCYNAECCARHLYAEIKEGQFVGLFNLRYH